MPEGKQRPSPASASASLCEKVPNVLSPCHTKRRMGVRGRAHRSFGMTPTFQKKKNLKSWCHTKRRMGTVMRTQDIRDLFVW